jgi:hypothetical protein
MIVCGCATEQGGATRARGSRPAIEAIHLYAVPVALNFDQAPGPDGFAARIYASNGRSSKGVPIKSGTLDVLMFDGGVKESELTTREPLRVWTYTAAELRELARKTSLGTGYYLSPRWDDAKPTRERFGVVARYTALPGVTIYSASSTISMTLK